MNIGETIEIHEIKPARVPVPQRERTSPGRTTKPRRFAPNKPKQPVEDPSKTPTRVPAK